MAGQWLGNGRPGLARAWPWFGNGLAMAWQCIPSFYVASDGLGWFSDRLICGILEAKQYAVVPFINISSGTLAQLRFMAEIAAH